MNIQELSFRDVGTLIEIINHYLQDHPEGDNAERGRELLEKLREAQHRRER